MIAKSKSQLSLFPGLEKMNISSWAGQLAMPATRSKNADQTVFESKRRAETA